jgi:hypothetical protein
MLHVINMMCMMYHDDMRIIKIKKQKTKKG